MASLALTIAGNALGGPRWGRCRRPAWPHRQHLPDRPVRRPAGRSSLRAWASWSIQGSRGGRAEQLPDWARSPVVGNVIWSSDFITEKVEEEVGGKGGGEKVTTGYNVYVHLAVLVSHNEISSIKKIFADGQLLYDSSPDKAVSSSLISIAKDSNLEMDINSPAGGRTCPSSAPESTSASRASRTPPTTATSRWSRPRRPSAERVESDPGIRSELPRPGH